MSLADVALSQVHHESVQFPGYIQNPTGSPPSESILVYLAVSGSVIPMRVLDSESIASVKLRIQTCKGFVVKKQKLVYGGRELARNDSLIKDYGVVGGNVLHLVLKLSDLLIINVKTVCGKELEFHVDRHRNVAHLKQRIAKEGKGLVDLQDQELFCEGEKLEDQKPISDISKDKDAVIHLLIQKSAKVRAKPIEKNFEIAVEAVNSNEKRNAGKPIKQLQVVPKGPPSRDVFLEVIGINPRIKLPAAIWDMVNSTSNGLQKGCAPIRSAEGTGGTYFMQDSSGQTYVSVFKPMDEEPNALSNPNGLPTSADGEGLKRGTKVGEGAAREVAAYLLDHPRNAPRWLSSEVMGFAGVPPTVMVRCLHKGFHHPNGYDSEPENVKIGSLQMFMKNFGSCEDIGPGNFPVEDVHKISMFDIRMANADRHSGNILIGKGEDGRTLLIPIDHGYCLPENFEDCTFDWLYWPQARQPYSADIVDYIRSLDAEQDIEFLKFCGWHVSIECARTLRISTMLLKKGVERGLTPFAIGSIMCRETVNKKAMIEEIIHEAQNSFLPGMSEAEFLETISKVMDARLDMLTA